MGLNRHTHTHSHTFGPACPVLSEGLTLQCHPDSVAQDPLTARVSGELEISL